MSIELNPQNKRPRIENGPKLLSTSSHPILSNAARKISVAAQTIVPTGANPLLDKRLPLVDSHDRGLLLTGQRICGMATVGSAVTAVFGAV